jgi:hypothetical protein
MHPLKRLTRIEKMTYVTEPNATAPTGDAGALYSALPAFFVPPAAGRGTEEDDLLSAVPGFDPLVLPVQASEEHLTAHWHVARDGRLLCSWGEADPLYS